MDGLIAIGLPVGNIVLKTPRHRFPEFMDITQHGIDIAWSIQDTADGNQIIDFIKAFLFILHLAVDRVDMLWSAINFSMQMAFPCIGLNLVDNLFDQFFSLATFFLHHMRNLVEFCLIQITERQIFKLPLDARNPETVGEWCIDFHGLTRNAFLLVLAQMLESAHIMQAVSQFNQNHADILRHGHKHLAVVFRQLLFVGLVLDLPELGHPIDDHAHIMTKFTLKIIQGRVRIFHDIMQKAAGNRHSIQFQLSKDSCHLNRVNNIRLTRLTELTTMAINCIDQSLLHKSNILR